MKKPVIIVFLLHSFLILTTFLNVSAEQEKDQNQEPIVEEVQVVNVLVPVRVYRKGQPVGELKKENFQLYENGEIQEINTFQAFSRQIKRDATGQTPINSKKIKTQSRFFVLIFNVFDFTDEVGQAIDNFFKNIYRETDKVVILTPERTFSISNSREMLESMPVLKNILKMYSRKARLELTRIFQLLEQEVNQFFESYFVDLATKVFISNYQRLWNQYAKKYLIPDIKKFQWFADTLKKVTMEKWVIVFQQREVFPQFKGKSRIEQRIKDWITSRPTSPTTPLLEQLLQRLDYTFKVSNNFPLNDIQEAFFRANATFHVLLFRSRQSSMSQDFEYKEAISDYENSFRAISRATGGDVILTNKLTESLQQVTQHKDIYYILSYVPRRKEDKNRKIKINVTDQEGHKLDVYYIRNLKSNPDIPLEKEERKIDVTGFSFRGRQMKFILIDYLRKKIENKTIGVIDLRIMLMDSNSETVVYNKNKILEATQKRSTINIRFNTIKKGNYHVILDLDDKLANTSRIFTEKITIK